ncbi:MAG: histidine phosphatase family protein [Oleibacter sp.]|nr:histidine phosphatase family protein [Thalassolituus sp.]
MPKLLIVRHGEASFDADTDANRQLTEFGIKQAQALAVQAQRLLPDAQIISSPYLRARQTGNELAERLGISMSFDDNLIPEAIPAKMMGRMLECDMDTILFSHMPFVDQLAAYLTGRGGYAWGTGCGLLLDGDVFAANCMTEQAWLKPE